MAASDPNTPDRGGSGLPPVEGEVNVGSASPDPAAIEFAIRSLGELFNLAFADARRLDHLGRLITRAFAEIGFDDRVELGEKHPRLTEGLILLEDSLDRMDRR